MNARTWVEIDLAAAAHNVSLVRRFLGQDPQIMAVVKADAYGLGAVPVGRHLLDCGCSSLAVNDIGEAVALRDAGITAPILILGVPLAEEIPEIVARRVTVTLHSAELIDALDEEARRRRRVQRIHLKIDTGLTRLGVPVEEAFVLACAIARRPHLALEGVYTHLTSAVSGNADVTRGQLGRFNRVLAALARAGLRPPIVHAANSAGLFAVPESRYDLVRPGIALYGMDPGLFALMGLDLRPTLTMRTRIVHLRAVPAGTAVGYEGTHRTSTETVIATCPIGYDDGYPWPLSNRGTVLVRGRRAPLVGRVSMNYVTLDVGGVPGVGLGDEVTLIGRDAAEEIRVEHLAKLVGTIPYELTCRIGRHLKRVYIGSLKPSAPSRTPEALSLKP
ncbi:MAG: alanine racemase [Planctomycetes bacterium]|nr:alanine racemase [Planctomycetota bacterium]